LIFYVYKVWWQKEKKPILINAALLLTFVLAMVALRYTYYHEVLPQTFFVKSGTLLERLGGAFSHTFEAASSVGGIVAVLFPLAVLYKVRNRKVWLLFSVLLFYLVFQLRFGWDWMPFYRFFTPYLPLFFAIYVLFSGNVLQSTKSRMILISAMILWMNVWATYYMKDGISAFYQPETNAHPYYQIAKELNGLTEEHDYVLYDEMGLIPFYSKAKFLDAGGLTDKFIGQTIYRNRIGDEPIMFRYFPMVFDYVKNKRPKVVILLSIHLPNSPSFPESLKKTWPYHVYHSSWFKKSYNHYKSFGRYHLFLRTDG